MFPLQFLYSNRRYNLYQPAQGKEARNKLNVAYLFLLLVTTTENFLPAVQLYVQISSPIPQDAASAN